MRRCIKFIVMGLETLNSAMCCNEIQSQCSHQLTSGRSLEIAIHISSLSMPLDKSWYAVVDPMTSYQLQEGALDRQDSPLAQPKHSIPQQLLDLVSSYPP